MGPRCVFVPWQSQGQQVRRGGNRRGKKDKTTKENPLLLRFNFSSGSRRDWGALCSLYPQTNGRLGTGPIIGSGPGGGQGRGRRTFLLCAGGLISLTLTHTFSLSHAHTHQVHLTHAFEHEGALARVTHSCTYTHTTQDSTASIMYG
ncbi:hypothetical protein LY76DRAFT_157632 [Colletotrichum caudatum]|nr:hypothetical protein LY76DRAFT_157632 [Colletotrichum caudatum]